MTDPTAVCSMIHEAAEQNSATRLFRGEPVLAWTLRRLERAAGHEAVDLCFSHTPPGLGGAVVRLPLLRRLAMAELHPGHLLHSSNDQLGVVACDGALPLPSAVTRAQGSFKLDSHRQI